MALNGSLLVDQLAPVDRSQAASARGARTERSPADTRKDNDAGSGSFDAALRESTAEKPAPRRAETSERPDDVSASDAASRNPPAAETGKPGESTGSSDKPSQSADPGETPADATSVSDAVDANGAPSGSEAAAQSAGGPAGTAPVLGSLLKAAGVTTDADIVLEGRGAAAGDGLAGALTDPADAIAQGSEARPATPFGVGATGSAGDASGSATANAARTASAASPAGSAALTAGNSSTAVTPDLAAAVQAALAEEWLSPDAARAGQGQAQSVATPPGGVDPTLVPDAAKPLAQRPVPGFENALVRGTRVDGPASAPASADADAALAALDADSLDGEAFDGDGLLSSRSRVATDGASGSTPAQAAASSTSLAGLQGAVSGAAGRFAALVGQGGAVSADAADVPAGLGGLEAAGAVKPDAAFATLTPQAVSDAAGPRTLSPAIVSAAGAIARGAAAGENRFSIRLDPPELGRVDVRLKIGDDGVARAHLIVERSETLDLFLRDQRNLERALEQAGVKTDAASLQFSLKGDGEGQTGFAAAEGDDGGRTAAADGEEPNAVDTAASDPSDRNHDGVLNITI